MTLCHFRNEIIFKFLFLEGVECFVNPRQSNLCNLVASCTQKCVDAVIVWFRHLQCLYLHILFMAANDYLFTFFFFRGWVIASLSAHNDMVN
jgi:hypothetical protein